MNEKTNWQILKEMLFGDIPPTHPRQPRSIDDLCIWKQSQLANSTAFKTHNPELLKCYTCTGYKAYAHMIHCDTYQAHPPQPALVKKRRLFDYQQAQSLYHTQIRRLFH